MSALSDKFRTAWDQWGLEGSDITTEYRFHSTRKWRFDFCWPSQMVAVEIHGFGFGHNSVAGLAKDCEKTRAAIELGWVVVPFTSSCIGSKAKREAAVGYVCELLIKKAEEQDGIEKRFSQKPEQ